MVQILYKIFDYVIRRFNAPSAGLKKSTEPAHAFQAVRIKLDCSCDALHQGMQNEPKEHLHGAEAA